MEQSSITGTLFAKQLCEEDELLNAQYCDIARLIYDTDDFIFPALFEGNNDPRNAAETVISHVIKKGTDKMYCKNNLFVCFDDSRIVGMVLWYQGSLEWNYEDFICSAAEEGVYLNSDNVKEINHTFFRTQKADSKSENADIITLVNVCVEKTMRGCGVGSFMMRNFVAAYEQYEMELCVLKENDAAVKLYINNGFEIISEYPGFSKSQIKPMCYGMQRIPSVVQGGIFI